MFFIIIVQVITLFIYAKKKIAVEVKRIRTTFTSCYLSLWGVGGDMYDQNPEFRNLFSSQRTDVTKSGCAHTF